MSYPLLAELELQLNVGRGVAIIVEGDAYHHDPYFYRYWFGDLARTVTFFPQNGWLQVRKAVQELRARGILFQLPNRPGRGQIALDDYLDRYMETNPEPPSDLHQIVMRILEHANLS